MFSWGLTRRAARCALPTGVLLLGCRSDCFLARILALARSCGEQYGLTRGTWETSWETACVRWLGWVGGWAGVLSDLARKKIPGVRPTLSMPPDDDLGDDDLPPLPPHRRPPLSPPPPPSSPRPSSSPSRRFALPQTLDEIRDGFRDIACGEAQKEHALSLTRLFHAMEMLLRHECAVRDARIVSLKNDLSRARLGTTSSACRARTSGTESTRRCPSRPRPRRRAVVTRAGCASGDRRRRALRRVEKCTRGEGGVRKKGRWTGARAADLPDVGAVHRPVARHLHPLHPRAEAHLPAVAAYATASTATRSSRSTASRSTSSPCGTS